MYLVLHVVVVNRSSEVNSVTSHCFQLRGRSFGVASQTCPVRKLPSTSTCSAADPTPQHPRLPRTDPGAQHARDAHLARVPLRTDRGGLTTKQCSSLRANAAATEAQPSFLCWSTPRSTQRRVPTASPAAGQLPALATARRRLRTSAFICATWRQPAQLGSGTRRISF